MVLACKLPPPPPHPCSGVERRIGGKGKDHRLRYEQFTGNGNEIRKWMVTATVLITECTRTLTTQSPTIPNLSLSNTLTQKGHLPLFLENDMRWYRITFRSKPCPCLATAKCNPVLARTSTVLYDNRIHAAETKPKKRCRSVNDPACLSGLGWLDLFEGRLEHAWQTSCGYGVQCFKRQRGDI